MRKILLDNALESWSIAVKYCKYIKNGLVTLHYKKTFVSALHNAVELLFKQIMLDNNDYGVIEKLKVKNRSDAQLYLDFYNSENLNVFFSKLSNEERNKFYSIEFNRFLDNKKLIKDTLDKNGITSIKSSLEILQELRNNETHFYVSSTDYLSEEQFVELHNLMIIIFEIMRDYNLLPFWGEPTKNSLKEYNHLLFIENQLSTFLYTDAIKNSPITKSIVNVLNGIPFGIYFDNAFSFAELYLENNNNSPYNFDEILSVSSSLFQMNSISITPLVVSDEIELDNGDNYPPQVEYIININI